MRAYARIVLVPSGGLAGPVRLPRAQVSGLCLNADDVAELARRLLCAQTRGLRWCKAADWRDWYGCRAQERGLCYSRGVGIAAAQRCRVRKLADCADGKQRIGGTGAVACVQARIVLATGNQLRAAYCVTVRASACRARSSAWTVEAGVCPATPTSPSPPVRRAQVHMRRRAGNGPRRVRAPMP